MTPLPPAVDSPEQRMAEIEARESAATQGAWLAMEADQLDPLIVRADDRRHVVLGADSGITGWEEGCWLISDEDIAFIAHARDDIPWLLTHLRATREALAETTKQLEAYRTPCWEFLPEDGDSGLSRVDWIAALLSDVRSWLTQYPQILAEHADADALHEGIREVDTLCRGLQGAVHRDKLAALAAPPSESSHV